jgi:hypothetical protein
MVKYGLWLLAGGCLLLASAGTTQLSAPNDGGPSSDLPTVQIALAVIGLVTSVVGLCTSIVGLLTVIRSNREAPRERPAAAATDPSSPAEADEA